MKKNLTHFLTLALSALGLGAAPLAHAAYVPVAVTGYNADVVANGTGLSINSTTIGIDAGGYVFMSQDYNPTGTSYLPTSGLINSAATAGVTFQMAPYTGNNSLRIPATGTGAVTFVTPQSAGEVYLLATSGSGAATADITVSFTDGTTQVFSGQTISDWYGGASYAILGLGRVQRGVENKENNASDPRLYQIRLTLTTANFAKLIQGISINKTSTSGVVNLMGVTINSVCNGTPAAGTPTSTTASACVGNSFTLNTTGAAFGSGITYQWQSSPAGANTFANIGTSQATSAYTVASQTAATDYRVVVTCAGSNLSSTSPIIAVPQSPFLNCYCTPTGGSCGSEWIRGVYLGALANASTCTTGGYVSYTTNAALTTTLAPGTTYPLTLDLHANATNSQAGVWIDYDHSGTFDATEYTLLGTGPATGFTNLDLSITGSLAVPATALTGATRMRVRFNNGAVVGNQACFNSYFGEVEDYIVTIAAATACTGTPAAGTATASATAICPATPLILRASGYSTTTTGLTFQWQSSPASANTFTAISGATTVPYTVPSVTAATDYRLQITCTASGLSSVSAPVSVALTPFTQCYCTPTYVSGGNNDIIRTVTLGTLVNNTSTLGNVAPYYHDYSAQQPATLAVPNLPVSRTTNVTLTFGSDANQYSALWIDFNHNGIFDSAEYFTLNTTAGTNGTAIIPVAIPATALLGQTKLRVRGGDDLVPLATQACGTSQSDYGEAEDYLVNLTVATASRTGQANIALTAFPNPATAQLTVQVGIVGPQAQVTLTDLTGKVLQTAAVANQSAHFNLSSLAAGIYLVRYQDANNTQTIKVSKQ